MEMQVNQMINEQAYEFLKMVERDLENIRSTSQVDPGVNETCAIQDVFVDSLIKRTLNFTFPTQEVPTDPTDPVTQVSITYALEADSTRNDSTMVNGEKVALYSVKRYRQENATATPVEVGTSGPIITNFAVTMYSRDGVPQICPDEGDLGYTQIEFEAASAINVEFLEENKRSVNNLNATRYGATIYSPNR